jgi:hypothetical protein
MKLPTRVEQGQIEGDYSCNTSGWPLSEISLKTKGGLLLAHHLSHKFNHGEVSNLNNL